ncbi:hypothetical protein HIM_10647 [Hirsutella minnesotensis 3608]|uniref:Uncharacterized protein n=1 Tax=Hirsutella minnesotensis 3608 TaxID=1043627 RepID=A0A0F7ZJT9_9HYPO|nr:hypothetical protein HIM_10647 [Hirsutella minnesotensis 3608]
MDTLPANVLPGDCVELITRHLKFTYTPKGLAKAYQLAAREEDNSCERIFLEAGGFSAWFAYFLAKRAAKSSTHFDGQAAINQLLESLPNIANNDQRELAERVRQAIPADIDERIQEIFEKAIRPSHPETAAPSLKRRRTTSDDDPAVPPVIPSTTNDDGPVLAPVISSPTPSTRRTKLSPEISARASRFDLSNPAVLRITTVFPTYTAGAITRYRMPNNGNSWVAAVTMSFLDVSSFGNKLGSMMSIEITSNKVERLANILFDAPLESMDNNRYLILPTGLRILPSPDLVLRGCKRHVILEIFGRDIYNAITASPAYKEEAEQGNPLTECVTMMISCQACNGAVIHLSLDEKEAIRVKDKLYE